VETVCRIEEDEFFDLEDFASRGDFLAKARTYQLYFNLVRPNSHKEIRVPAKLLSAWPHDRGIRSDRASVCETSLVTLR
jgi:hypothetical protein